MVSARLGTGGSDRLGQDADARRVAVQHVMPRMRLRKGGRSAAQLIGKVGDAVRRPVPFLRLIGVGRAAAAIFVRARDEGGGKAAGARGGQVAVMRRDEAEPVGR